MNYLCGLTPYITFFVLELELFSLSADVEALMKNVDGNAKESTVLNPAPKATCFMFRNMKMCYCPTGYKWNMETLLCESLGT